MALTERSPMDHTSRWKLPELQPGVSIALLKRVWFATPANRRHLRATLLESIVCVDAQGFDSAKPLVDLTLAEVEACIGAATPRFVVSWWEAGKKGVQAQTFVVRDDADKFAVGKRLYTKPATVKELGL